MRQIKAEIKWAVVFFVVILIWVLLERMVGLHDKYISSHTIYTNLFALLAIGIYVMALMDKRRFYYQGYMSYWQGLKTGLIMTIIIVALVPLAQYLTHTYISPDYFTNISEMAVLSDDMTRPEAEAYFSLNHYIQLSVIMAATMGVVTSLIVAFFTRSR